MVWTVRSGTPEEGRETVQKSNMWAVGLTAFAACVLMIGGIFQAISGLVAIVDNEFYVVTRNYFLEFDVTAWGWIHLVLGIVVAVAGFMILRGAVWARMVGVVVAVISAIANFAFIPYYPVWSLLIIALNIAVIWALTAHGRDLVA